MTTYYVDSSAGADGSGSIGSPFNNIAGHIGSLVAGDIMYLRGGANAGARRTYNESVEMASSWTPGSPITLASYPGEYVRLTGPNGAPIIKLNGPDGWIIEGDPNDDADTPDMHFQIDCNDRGSQGYGILLDNGANDNIIRRLEIFNGAYNPALLRIASSHRNTISRCRIWDNSASPGVDRHGIYISATSTTTCDDNVVEYCRIFDCAGDCIQIQNTSGAGGIHNTIIRHNQLYTTLGGASENAIDDKDGQDTLIYGNTMYGFRDCDGSVGGSGADGEAIVTHDAADNAQIYDNVIYDCSGNAVAINCPTGALIHHNLIYDWATEASIGEKSVIYVIAGAITFQNNTVIGKNGASGKLFRFLNNTGATIKNNIFEDTGTIQQGTGLTLVYDHNGWFNVAESLSGTGDVTGTTAGFTNKAGDNYTLAGGSPCIDAGVDVGYAFSGSAPDLGALEVEAGGGGGTPVELNINVAASNDDGRENTTGGINRTETSLIFFTDSPRYVAVLIRNVTIPPGETVASAIIRFVASSSAAGANLVYEISCHDVDNSTEITNITNNISSRPRTTATVNWTLPVTTAGNTYDTPDFSPALQEVVDRPGFASGNSVMVIFRRISNVDSSNKQFYSFDNGANVPQLRATYLTIVAEERQAHVILLPMTSMLVVSGG